MRRVLYKVIRLDSDLAARLDGGFLLQTNLHPECASLSRTVRVYIDAPSVRVYYLLHDIEAEAYPFVIYFCSPH